ncbi:MAG: hypothetical protein R3B06_02045 [Kofleriaceae bacterium]
MLSIAAARWLMIAHAILGAAVVAAATHWVVWLWPLWRGRAPRAGAMRRFALITMALYALALVAGLLLYPTYKARVKLEYLTRPASVIDDAAGRALAAAELSDRAAGEVPRPPDVDRARRLAGDEPTRAAKIARWFDAKEHWAALGLVLGLGVLVVARRWQPGRDEPIADGPVGFVVLGALGVAAAAWFAAIVGLLTAATRSF